MNFIIILFRILYILFILSIMYYGRMRHAMELYIMYDIDWFKPFAIMKCTDSMIILLRTSLKL